MIAGTLDDTYAQYYWRVKREPIEGTMTDAIREHSVACGLVAYVFGVHPDTIAHAVAEHQKYE